MIKVSRDTLLGPLQRVLSVIERRHTLPILSNVLIEIDEQGSATLKATDLEVELHASLELESDGPRRVTLPARKLGDIVRALPDGVEITIEFDSGHAVIRAGRSRFRLQTLGADEFPSIERTEVRTRLAVPQKVAKWLVDKAQFSMAHQDVRYYLNGMLLEVDGKHVRSVATDGHRLAMAEHEIATDVDSVIQVIVPRKGINEIGRMVSDVDDDVSIAIGQGHVEFSVEGARLISKLIDGRFPDYRRVVPQGGDKLVSANRVGLREALARASILSNEKYRGIGLELQSGAIRIFAHNPEQEEAEESIEVDYKGAGMAIGFNVGYFLEVLGAIDGETVEMVLSDPNSSCLVREPGRSDYLYVVMPMRL